jgi:hypothetical protein
VKGDTNVEFGDVSLTTPWPDLIQVPGMNWQEHKKGMHSTSQKLPNHSDKTLNDFWNRASFPFRIFKSHYTPTSSGGFLPVTDFPKVKFVAMARNGLDVVTSLIPFFSAHRDEFRTLWGGFPPNSSGDVDVDAETRLSELLPGGTLYALYFSYVKEWWPLRNEPNVLLLHYADAKKDLKGTVSKLASFYDVDLSATELDSVTDMCSFEHMKRNTELFSYELPLNPNYSGKIMHHGSLTRKGENGGGELTFNDDQKSRWRLAEEEEFRDSTLLGWAREGGDSKKMK